MAEEKAITTQLAGRTLNLRRPTSAQLILLHRATRATRTVYDAMQGSKDDEARTELASKGLMSAGGILDVIERLVIAGDDRDWLTEQILEGTLDLNDLLVIIRAVSADDEEDETPAPVKKAAKKAAPRAAAK